MKPASRGSPAWTLCGARRVAASFLRHKAMPGTPMGRAVRVPGNGFGLSLGYGFGYGRCPGRWILPLISDAGRCCCRCRGRRPGPYSRPWCYFSSGSTRVCFLTCPRVKPGARAWAR